MDQSQNSEEVVLREKNKPNFFATLLIGISIVVGVSVVSYAWHFYTTKKNDTMLVVDESQEVSQEVKDAGQRMVSLHNSEKVPEAAEGKDAFNYGLVGEYSDLSQPTGFLVFSGDTKSSKIQSTRIHTLDLTSSTSKPDVYIPDYPVSAMAEFDNPSSPTNLFLLTVSDESKENEADKLGVHKLAPATGDLESFSSTVGKNERNFAWSQESGLLAFSRASQTSGGKYYADLLPVANWEVVVVDPKTDTNVALLSNAVQPKWSSDGSKLFFLKTDGLYMYTISTKEQSKVVGVAEGGSVITTSMIDVSPDGKYLVWTTAKSGVITVYEIVSEEGETTLVELGRIQVPETEFYWPQFSPDGKYYAVQAIDVLGREDAYRKNSRVEIRPTINKEVVYRHTLEDFYFDALFTNDWVTTLPKQ